MKSDNRGITDGILKVRIDFSEGIPVEKRGDLPIEEFSIEGLKKGEFFVKVNPGKNSAEITLKIDFERELTCSRCLENFVKRSELTEWAEAVISDKESFVEDEGIVQIIDKVADLTNIIRDMIILDEGMRPLCKEDCKGLCPLCGENLNNKVCGCDLAEGNNGK